jgi:hypothetical protein
MTGTVPKGLGSTLPSGSQVLAHDTDWELAGVGMGPEQGAAQRFDRSPLATGGRQFFVASVVRHIGEIAPVEVGSLRDRCRLGHRA